MSRTATLMPRSTLHALPPLGLGTSEVESLTSYFCRLANSHACTTNDLAQFVIDRIAPGRWATHEGIPGKSRFLWHHRSISGISDAALTWTSALSELTGILNLHRLTLLPLQSIVAPKGLMATQARWCPHCLEEDGRQSRAPYFRLAWDIGLNKVCTRHGAELEAKCPHCQKSNVRHAANFVVPGWCTACNHFLGVPQSHGPIQPPSALQQFEREQADTIGQLLAMMGAPSEAEDAFRPSLDAFHQAVERLVGEMDGGVASHFAKRLGVRKSTVHYWKSSRTALTLDALIRIALHCNISLAHLMQGRMESWVPPPAARQLSLELNYPSAPSHRPARKHDWPAIRQCLREELMRPVPRSVAQIAKALDIDDRHLYLQATAETRLLGQRYVEYLGERNVTNQAAIHQELREACMTMRERGEGITVEQVGHLIGARTLNSARRLYSVLSDFAAEAANEAAV